MLTAHCGIRKRKLIVPSSGSTTQRSPLVPSASPPSSPRKPSPGRAAASRSRISRSAAWSASETRSVGLDLAVTFTRSPPNASRSWCPASRATASAISRSAPGLIAADAGRAIRSASSSCAASASSVGSPSRGATSWTASGKPSGVKPAGTDAAGWPVWLYGPQYGTKRTEALSVTTAGSPSYCADRAAAGA